MMEDFPHRDRFRAGHICLDAHNSSDKLRHGSAGQEKLTGDVVDQSDKSRMVATPRSPNHEQIQINCGTTRLPLESPRVCPLKSFTLERRRELHRIRQGLDDPQEKVSIRRTFGLEKNREAILRIREKEINPPACTAGLPTLMYRVRSPGRTQLVIDVVRIEHRLGWAPNPERPDATINVVNRFRTRQHAGRQGSCTLPLMKRFSTVVVMGEVIPASLDK